MPALYILGVVALTILWFLLAFLFKPLGRLCKKIFTDTIKIITEEDGKDEKVK